MIGCPTSFSKTNLCIINEIFLKFYVKQYPKYSRNPMSFYYHYLPRLSIFEQILVLHSSVDVLVVSLLNLLKTHRGRSSINFQMLAWCPLKLLCHHSTALLKKSRTLKTATTKYPSIIFFYVVNFDVEVLINVFR